MCGTPLHVEHEFLTALKSVDGAIAALSVPEFNGPVEGGSEEDVGHLGVAFTLGAARVDVYLGNGAVVASEYLFNIPLLVLLRVQKTLVDVIIFTADKKVVRLAISEVQARRVYVPLAHVLLHMYDIVGAGGFLVTTHVFGDLEEEVLVGGGQVVFTPLADLPIIRDTCHD